jgi:hypothetical protein
MESISCTGGRMNVQHNLLRSLIFRLSTAKYLKY